MGEEHSKGRSFKNQRLQLCGMLKGKGQDIRGGGLEITGKGCQKGLWTKSEALGDGPRIWARALDSHK